MLCILKVTDCIVLLCIFSFSVLFDTSSGYYQLIDLLHITHLHNFTTFSSWNCDIIYLVCGL